MWSKCNVEEELRMVAAMNNDRRDIDLFHSPEFELKEKYTIEGEVASWTHLKSAGEKTLHEKFGRIGELSTAMRTPHPKAGDPVNEVSCPHLMQYRMDDNTEYFVFMWDVFYGGDASDETKDPNLFAIQHVQIYHTSLTYVSTPPTPSKPLVINEGSKQRKPKVCLVIGSHPMSWGIRDPFIKSQNVFPIICLYQRMEYVRALFVGCEVDMLAFRVFDKFWDMMKSKGWTRYTGDESFELCRRIRSQSYDFGLFLTIRKDRRDPGMGYGLSECNERLVLRAMGLACNSNFLFGDWGIAGDYWMACNEWDNLELSGGFDRNHYQNPHLCERLHRYVNGRIPYHACPFARLVRLDRFLRTIPSDEKGLSQQMIDKVWLTCRRECFSRANMLATWWSVKNGLCFPNDFNKWGIYAWRIRSIQIIQSWIVLRYREAQRFRWTSFELEWADFFLRVATSLKRVLWVIVSVVLVLFSIAIYLR